MVNDVVGDSVCGDTLLGDTVGGETVVGETVVGLTDMGDTVVGDTVVGLAFVIVTVVVVVEPGAAPTQRNLIASTGTMAPGTNVRRTAPSGYCERKPKRPRDYKLVGLRWFSATVDTPSAWCTVYGVLTALRGRATYAANNS